MSIINDALKRAQQKLEQQGKHTDIKEVTKTETSDKAIVPESKKKKQPKKKKKTWYKSLAFLIPLFLIITGMFVTSIFLLINRSSETTGLQNIYRSKKNIGAPIDKNDIALNGISYIENRRVALINNEIYEEGDTIGQYIIHSIESTIVLLIDPEGELITLKVR